MTEPTLDELDQRLTDAAVQTLITALACARARAESKEMRTHINNLSECRVEILAVGNKMRFQLFVPAETGGELRFFMIDLEEQTLQ